MRRVILASTSPRRRELFKKLNIPFEIIASDYAEDMTLALPPRKLAMHLARGKAEAVARMHDDAIVVGADTFLVFEGRVIGKPRDAKEAARMLGALSGKAHTILTGFAVIDSADRRDVGGVEEARVYFKALSSGDISGYIESGEPLDKAGAYAIQGMGAKFIDRIEGDYDAIVGLPVERIKEALQEFGILA
ncbi:MAG: Maf family protein [bacterium]|nr:Maf family protein [bacterium]